MKRRTHHLDGWNVETTTWMDEKHLDETQREAQLNHLDGWNAELTTWTVEKKLDETRNPPPGWMKNTWMKRKTHPLDE
jgi:hypothetical protein